MSIMWGDAEHRIRVRFDATPSETHMVSAAVTEHPVEVGAPISDNIRPTNPKITVEVVISNMPIVLPGADEDSFTNGATLDLKALELPFEKLERITAGASGSSPATFAQNQSPSSGRGDIPYATKARTLQASTDFDRVHNVYEALSSLIGTNTLVTIVTSLMVYDDMAILSMSVPRSAQMGKAIKFTMDCQRVRTVETQNVKTPAPLHQPTKAGHKGAPEEKDEGVRRSVAKAVKGGPSSAVTPTDMGEPIMSGG